MDELSIKLNSYFGGKVVRKDLTQKLKQGANVPTYVLEYLLGMYCATDDDDSINDGVERVKSILADNFVRPDEAEKIKSKIKEMSRYTVIDKLTVKLNERKDIYIAEFSNLGIKDVEIDAKYVKDYEKLLGGGIWCIVKIQYLYDETTKNVSPFLIEKVTPIQMPNMDMDELVEGRKQFTKEEWIDVLIKSIGMEPTQLKYQVKWHMLLRMVPLCENNYNMCELGPRGTGKSHLYKEISPNSILISGGQTTVANLFYNMSQRKIGLVGMWDTVAFDEVAGMTFKDKDAIQIMKDYMASGSFARGKEEKAASASMVFLGNINQSVDVLLKTSHLFDPFPEIMANDSAFFDRMHFYLPGWEIPKMRPEFFTDSFGLITDYLSEYLREMRKKTYGDVIDKYFKLGNNLNQRDVIAVRKTVSGLVKLIYPHGEFTKGDIEEILRYALVGRRRVKEQLKKIGGMEFYDVHFSYIDNETMSEEFISVPEQGSGSLIPEGAMKAGQIYTIGVGDSGMIGVYKIETEVVNGSGKFEKTGLGYYRDAKESIETAFRFFKANSRNISASISTTRKDYLMHIQDVNGVGMTSSLSLAAIIAMCSGALMKPVQSQVVVIGSVSIGGTIDKVDDLANTLQVCFDAGAKKILLPMVNAGDLATVPPELFAKFQIMFYGSAEDAVFKALGVQ
ncbi:protease Lon-related BREX system protein BrxL [Clostridium estertheticum]|uniref:protease Lon-related BREX system protein BrxL n=1 Tax=Clostridium estertheticum TaxID=238834 RepID=UPI001C7D3F20|nr:protease Lon-related BREX system protein BrxL [Clostridium estertheticum]MBX4261946.1 protease Lon-related BREX system protein BrxL [Clostridium estertheticum]WLC68634.1 protease Lon-related BREX system protein BrxL [Clostridium estertheticum]